MTIYSPAKASRVYENPAELQSDLEFWKKELRLQDWDIKLEMVRAHVFQHDYVGDCGVSLGNKTAHIRIMDSIDVTGSEWFPLDQEEILVHELLHIHLEPFFPKDGHALNFMGEQAIESIAKALVHLRRQSGFQTESVD